MGAPFFHGGPPQRVPHKGPLHSKGGSFSPGGFPSNICLLFTQRVGNFFPQCVAINKALWGFWGYTFLLPANFATLLKGLQLPGPIGGSFGVHPGGLFFTWGPRGFGACPKFGAWGPLLGALGGFYTFRERCNNYADFLTMG